MAHICRSQIELEGLDCHSMKTDFMNVDSKRHGPLTRRGPDHPLGKVMVGDTGFEPVS